MAALVLLRYGELALKSPPVRREFERTLKRNVLDQFLSEKASCRIRADHGHMYVEADDSELALRLLRRVFGVTSASLVHEVPTDRALITQALLALAEPILPPGTTFAVRARRTGTHPFTSQELARDLGGDVLDRWPDRALKVRLDDPAVELHVEVRGPRTYLSLGRVQGPGGLPLGVAGRVVALVDGKRGALGAYLMMKRGCRTSFVTTGPGLSLVERTLLKLDPHAGTTVAPPGDDEPTASLRAAADAGHADGVVLPISVEGYAEAHGTFGDRVLFSPTVAFTDEEVERRWHEVEEVAS
ncbi:MAG: THUMP domain-containing protein [Thermoplasmata archaeon]|nr:THUMP domain-containing protein [Thermoplasmata archaeon]